MGGKSKSSNDQSIAFQREQAAEARAREEQRKARLETGKSSIDALFDKGNFNDAFYDKYKDAALDYAMPQLTDQYGKARDQTTYDLARAGTLRSTIAGDAQADIESQKLINEAGIKSKADTDVAGLRTNIAGQKQQALNQLYATEDPDVAANTATHMVQQAQLSTPNLSPLGELFKPLIIGATGAASGYLDQQTLARYGLTPRGPSQGTPGSGERNY
jgi:hypothetical protein